jgi:hypothetical protein
MAKDSSVGVVGIHIRVSGKTTACMEMELFSQTIMINIRDYSPTTRKMAKESSQMTKVISMMVSGRMTSTMAWASTLRLMETVMKGNSCLGSGTD